MPFNHLIFGQIHHKNSKYLISLQVIYGNTSLNNWTQLQKKGINFIYLLIYYSFFHACCFVIHNFNSKIDHSFIQLSNWINIQFTAFDPQKRVFILS
jgi:hypothetical protein